MIVRRSSGPGGSVVLALDSPGRQPADTPKPHGPRQPVEWSPVLEGAEHDLAQGVLRAIAGILREPVRYEDVSLMHGAAGAALCLGYLGDAWHEVALADAAVALLARSAEELGTSARPELGLARGAAGVAWVVEHLRTEFLWEVEADGGKPLDDLLGDHVDVASKDHPLGLLEGVSGMGVYLLERLPTARTVLPVLERILLCLVEAREGQMGFGCTWWTPPVFIPESERPARPFGHYDLGVAHGVPGILGFLGRLAGVGVGHSVVTGLLRRGISWLLSKRVSAGEALPRSWGTNVPPVAGPETWEYGTLSAAAVLHLAALGVDDTERAAELLAWLRRAASRLDERHVPAENGLCSGTAGLGHVCNRLFHRTGDSFFAEHARRWLGRTLDSLRDSRRSWREALPDPSLRSGLAGAALALLAATTDQEPAWDRLLLLSAAGPRTPPGAGAAA